MGILLVTATKLEMQAALAGLVPAEKAVALAHALSENKSPVTGIQACGHILFPLICGVGPVSAGLRLGVALEALRQSPVSGILNLGLGGSYDTRKAPLGSVVGATCEIFPEFGLRRGDAIDAHGLNFAQALTSMGEIVDRIPPEALPDADPEKGLGNMGLNCHTLVAPSFVCGPSVTVAGVSADPEYAAAMARRTGGLMENMEGFALALGAAQHKLPFVELRAISNAVGYRPPEHWDIPGALAALTKTAAGLFTGTAY